MNFPGKSFDFSSQIQKQTLTEMQLCLAEWVHKPLTVKSEAALVQWLNRAGWNTIDSNLQLPPFLSQMAQMWSVIYVRPTEGAMESELN